LAPLANYRSLVSGVSELLPPEEGRKRTMLVVDDSHTVRCFLQRTFEMVRARRAEMARHPERSGVPRRSR
jgi:hypothetical protein